MWINYDYTYDPTKLDMAKLISWNGDFDWVVLLIIFVWLAIAVLYYITLPYINWYFIVTRDDKKKIENKRRIQELILMKEVQNELEKEMEDTLLNAWLSKQHLHS